MNSVPDLIGRAMCMSGMQAWYSLQMLELLCKVMLLFQSESTRRLAVHTRCWICSITQDTLSYLTMTVVGTSLLAKHIKRLRRHFGSTVDSISTFVIEVSVVRWSNDSLMIFVSILLMLHIHVPSCPHLLEPHYTKGVLCDAKAPCCDLDRYDEAPRLCAWIIAIFVPKLVVQPQCRPLSMIS